ncbi:hypothetical protein MBLNU13_g11378t1 [Cladosporium sp. NU13]
MARGRQVYLSYTALVLLSLTTYTTADLWSVDIDLGPAPLPEDGPPFSAHASRDKSLLPFQIVGIIGSYLASVFIIVTLLLTVGRSRRKTALDRAADARCTEMVKPMNRAFDPSPISPVSSRSWYSPRKLKSKKSVSGSMRSGGMGSPISPTGASVISFDAAVVEADKQKRQEEMERLYAAVMAQDERRSQQQAASPPLPPPPPIPSGSPPEYSRKRPPRLITNAPNLKHLQPSSAQYSPSPCSPSTPKSPIRAIYPPDGHAPPMPSGPASPIRAAYPSNAMSPIYQPHQDQLFANRGRSASEGSQRSSKKIRKSLKNIKISSPMLDDNSDGARTPLSPRFYPNPGIPPDPPTARTTDTTDSQAYPPTTPGTGRSWRYGDDIPREVPQEENFDQIRAVPQPNPQRKPPRLYQPPPAAPSPPRTTGLSAPLPFRQIDSLHAPAPAKTTFLEAKPRNHFLSAAMGTPRTGLATPYSPYMPFTPLTPVTPRLATRGERKQRMREERAIRGAIVEEDAVKEEGELWGSGY